MNSDYGEWEVRIEFSVANLAHHVWIHRRVGFDALEVARPDGRTWTVRTYTKEELCTTKVSEDGPSFEIPDLMARALLPSLVRALDERGIKMPEKSYMEGELVATKQHLADLQRLLKLR